MLGFGVDAVFVSARMKNGVVVDAAFPSPAAGSPRWEGMLTMRNLEVFCWRNLEKNAERMVLFVDSRARGEPRERTAFYGTGWRTPINGIVSRQVVSIDNHHHCLEGTMKPGENNWATLAVGPLWSCLWSGGGLVASALGSSGGRRWWGESVILPENISPSSLLLCSRKAADRWRSKG